MNHEIPQRHMANRRMLAIAAVLIMMLSVVPLSIILSDSDTEADTDGRVQVTYNVGEVSIEDGYNYGFSKSSYTFTYYGKIGFVGTYAFNFANFFDGIVV